MDSAHRRMKLDPYLKPLTKTNSKWIENLNVRPETIKVLGKKIGKELLTLVLAKCFLDMTSKAQATKAKMNKWDSIKLKLLHGNHPQNEKAAYQMGKRYLQTIPDKGLISKTFK